MTKDKSGTPITPLVSVIVTTYNRRELLGRTLKSILNQTYTNFELIVVDNFSNYDFFEYINSFADERIIPFQNANNGIIAVNRNFGIGKARGEYLAFCDDDDLWMPDKLERQISIINEKGVDLVCTNLTRFSNSIESVSVKNAIDSVVTLSQLLRKNPIATSSVLVKNTNRIHFSESKTLVTVEDYELWLRLYMEGTKIYYLGIPALYYREYAQNTSSGKNKVLLPIRRIGVISEIKINYDLGNWSYVFHVLVNLLEFLAKLIIK